MLLTAMQSCSLFGLDYAYDFKHTTQLPDSMINMTAYEFIQSRSVDKFSLWFEMINHADMRSFYEEEGHTYFILDDEQVAEWLTSYRYSSVQQIPLTLAQYHLKGYTIDGIYNSAGLTTNYTDVPALDGDHVIRMRLYPNATTASQNLNAMQAGWVNLDGTANLRSVVTSNLRCTNGIIHVVSVRFIRPQ